MLPNGINTRLEYKADMEIKFYFANMVYRGSYTCL